MNLQDWLYPALVILTGYLVMGITGFGSALVTVPLLAWKWPLPEVVVLAILLDVPASILHGGLNAKQVRWQELAGMLPGMTAGSLIGLWLVGQLDKRWPLFFLGVYIAVVGYRALRQKVAQVRPLSPAAYHASTTMLGVIEVMFATAGPVVLAILQRRLSQVTEIRATVPVVMVVAGSVAIAVLAGSGQIDSTHALQRWLVAMPIAAAGVILGNRLAQRIPAPLMRRLMAGLLMASGLFLTRHLWL
ncbi:MAG: sulfite exporter TauE/SafE family protein [Pseudomonadota bacterium]